MLGHSSNMALHVSRNRTKECREQLMRYRCVIITQVRMPDFMMSYQLEGNTMKAVINNEIPKEQLAICASNSSMPLREAPINSLA